MPTPPSAIALGLGHSQKAGDGKKRARKRIRAFTPDDRAAHRIIEKQRREALNQNFIELARLLPGLVHVRRLSKSLIVNESISYLKAQREIRLAAAREIRDLLADYDNLLIELKKWQAPFNPALTEQRQTRPERKALSDLLKVEQEEFGSFLGGFGDNGPNDEHDEDHGEESDSRIQGENNANYFDGEDFAEMSVQNHPRLTGEVDIVPSIIEQAEIPTDLLPRDELYDFPLQQTTRPLTPSLLEPLNLNHPLEFGLDGDLNPVWGNESGNQIPYEQTPSTTSFSSFPSGQDLYSPGILPQNYQGIIPFVQHSNQAYAPFEITPQEKLGFQNHH